MSPRILRTTRALVYETVMVEQPAGFDGQGRTLYDTPVGCEANVLEYDAERREGQAFVVAADGSEHRVALTLYVQGDEPEAVVPEAEARVTLADGRRFIASDIRTVSGLRYSRLEPDHYRIRCRVT